jgi:putative transcription antitermination factor YqgF
MKRYLALDVGLKRIGVATSFGDTVLPLKVVTRSKRSEYQTLLTLTLECKPVAIILGIPLSDDSSMNEQCAHVLRFEARLRKTLFGKVQVPIYLVDEFASTIEVKERLFEYKLKAQDIDCGAAAVILELFLENP